MSEQASSSGGFLKAFVPGLIVGFIVGAAVGVIVGSTGRNITKLAESNDPIDRPAMVDENRDGYPDDIEGAIEEGAAETEETIDDAIDEVEDGANELERELNEQDTPVDGDG